jgi:hypothetical protein
MIMEKKEKLSKENLKKIEIRMNQRKMGHSPSKSGWFETIPWVGHFWSEQNSVIEKEPPGHNKTHDVIRDGNSPDGDSG